MKHPVFSLLFLFLTCVLAITQNEENYHLKSPPQNLITYDAHSFSIRGERLMIYSGEFHPFRLPVPGLYHDIFQKIKALGFNTVSFYLDWGLLEGKRGRIITTGIFALEPFFEAAKEAGIYLIARPGPYINAEVAAGGFPGWVLRSNGTLRSMDREYLNATALYVRTVGEMIAKAQITNGGPVILVQPENEYGSWPGVSPAEFPNKMNREYIEFVNQQYRDAGIVVPLINNDNFARGSFAPGSGRGSVDVYGIDAYPMRYDCANPKVWPTYRWPEGWREAHTLQSPSTPFAIPEFQGGSGTSWEGVDQNMCNELVNEEAVRVFHKHTYSFGVKLLNIYMTFGGTSWGNLGFMGGSSSYDYGAAISENRHVSREKYSETKLQAHFFKVSPAYLTAIPGKASNVSHTDNPAITVTPLTDTMSKTQFLVVRHADFTELGRVNYLLTLSTSAGNLSLPQLGGELSLQGRDSKIHVVDYDVGGIKLVYSTAEIFTWAKSRAGKTVLIVYGGAGETHEMMIATQHELRLQKDSGVRGKKKEQGWILHWDVRPERRAVTFEQDRLEIHLLWRNDAYNHWVVELEGPGPVGNYSSLSKEVVIVRGGYLMKNASIAGNELRFIGDVNATTHIEIIYEPTDAVTQIVFNSLPLNATRAGAKLLTATVTYEAPVVRLPDFNKLEWTYIDSLPELHATYDDSQWTSCNHTSTTNPTKLLTPTSLYASDYGYHSASFIYRGHFKANGREDNLSITTAGGFAFGHSIWLNDTFIGSWTGRNVNQTYQQTLTLSKLLSGSTQVITVLIDHMGQDEEAPGTDSIKAPLGILDYHIGDHVAADISWKMTGNLGGEEYHDLDRGPRNEGALFVERQGYHFPSPPTLDWNIRSPLLDGIDKAGVGFFATSFVLNVPMGYDVPMNFVFAKNDHGSDKERKKSYRCQLFVNGYQFGKYVSNLGPQSVFPVPEGILNYNGTNWIAVSLWALEGDGARMGIFELKIDRPVMSSYRKPALSPQTAWKQRHGAY